MNVVFVGLGGVPYSKRAADVRLESFANLFISIGCKVKILNRFPSSISGNKGNLSKEVSIIELFNKKSYLTFIRSFFFLLSFPLECICLISMSRKEKVDILHLYSGHYVDFLYYFLISRILKAKLVYQYVEMRSGIKHKNPYRKINGLLCDKFGYKLFDGIICISEYIVSYFPKAQKIKIPPICDISFYDSLSIQTMDAEFSYICYCGNVGYLDVIQKIMQAYNNSILPHKGIKLVLILNGDQAKRDSLVKTENIIIKKDLTYTELVLTFKRAKALLIPLRNSIQDIARFPNKICEYTACKGLIITTNVGEISYYFKDKVNALIAKDFSNTDLVDKLNELSELPEQSIHNIKDASYKICLEFFDISNYIKPFKDFIFTLCLK